MDGGVGLCLRCTHARRIRSNKRRDTGASSGESDVPKSASGSAPGRASGSEFWLCGRSAEDPRYRKYPPLPVVRCEGYDDLAKSVK